LKTWLPGTAARKAFRRLYFLHRAGVVNAENFIEVGAGAIHLGYVEVVDHDGEGKLAKVVAVQLNLFDAFAEFPDLDSLESSSNMSCGLRRSC